MKMNNKYVSFAFLFNELFVITKIFYSAKVLVSMVFLPNHLFRFSEW